MIAVDRTLPIAIVDDDDVDRMIIGRVLERSELANDVLEFGSGVDMLDHLTAAANGDSPVPALVLSDINMPGLSGFDLLREIRAMPAFVVLPIVVMLTSSEAHRDKELARTLGATAYLAKQSGIAAFVEVVNSTFAN